MRLGNITGACTCDCGRRMSSELGSGQFVAAASFVSSSALEHTSSEALAVHVRASDDTAADSSLS